MAIIFNKCIKKHVLRSIGNMMTCPDDILTNIQRDCILLSFSGNVLTYFDRLLLVDCAFILPPPIVCLLTNTLDA